jgi:hypothetical protein
MILRNILVFISGISFLYYGIAYINSKHLKMEFKRFGLEKTGILIAILQFLGGTGLLVGLRIPFFLIFSSGGLALLMLFGIVFRIKAKDTFWVTLPALFFMLLNGYIFYVSKWVHSA